jgi:hypothetical protein
VPGASPTCVAQTVTQGRGAAWALFFWSTSVKTHSLVTAAKDKRIASRADEDAVGGRGRIATRILTRVPMAAAPAKRDYDHLIKLLLIGDSGAWMARRCLGGFLSLACRREFGPHSLTFIPLPHDRRRQVMPAPALCGGPVHVQLHYHDRVSA